MSLKFTVQSWYQIYKVEKLKTLIESKNASALIQVDGGVNLETGKRLVNSGANVLVTGSFVFNSTDPAGTIRELKRL